MIGTGAARTLPLIAVCVIAEIGRELCFKSGATRAGARDGGIVAIASQPAIWLGIVLWAAELCLWLAVLQRADLAFAYPVMAATYAGVPLAGVVALGERLSRWQVVGAAFVAVGVVCVGASGL